MPLWQTLLAGRPAISSPLRLMEPAVGMYMPAMQLKMVLLPDPFGPIRPRISPSSTWNDTFDTAVKPLNTLVRPETPRRDTRSCDGMGQPLTGCADPSMTKRSARQRPLPPCGGGTG